MAEFNHSVRCQFVDVDPNREGIDTGFYSDIGRQLIYQSLSVNRATTSSDMSEDEDLIWVGGFATDEVIAAWNFIEDHLSKIEWRARNFRMGSRNHICNSGPITRFDAPGSVRAGVCGHSALTSKPDLDERVRSRSLSSRAV